MPNVCQCVPNYYGSSCEIAKVLCETLPPESAYSYRKCDSECVFMSTVLCLCINISLLPFSSFYF